MAPIRFVFGLHLHQPVGNFDHVFREHVRDVYRPILEYLSGRDFVPIVLHLSGPLLEWLEENDTSYLDLVGKLVTERRVELLLAGFYEPVLASLPRADRIEQIQWMQEAVRGRFGVTPRGLWLTERVWEPELAADLADAGVRYALVDDRHFLVSGFASDRLHAPYWTESDGKRVALFPIDERLRYLIPFRPPEETAAYLRELRGAGHQLAVLADDGEKFGGWPGTKEWVYERGWLEQFMGTIGELVESGEVQLSTLSDALEAVPSGGIAYLPTASYREMEGWSLPPDPALRLIQMERDLGEGRVGGPDGALIRGAHWRNFLVKYSESNRMHKKMQALSLLCRRRGDPAAARRAIGRAQCNDAYWHGVFGGLYLPHLREAIWRNLALAEQGLRQGETLEAEVLDLDGDGHDEIWVHSDQFSAVVSPKRGAVIEEYTIFANGTNYANTLTRRREAYHDTALENQAEATRDAESGTPSIHDIEEGLRLDRRPPLDADDRALFVDRVLPAGLDVSQYASGDYQPIRSWARTPVAFTIERSAEAIEIALVSASQGGPGAALHKRIRFGTDGTLMVAYRWDRSLGQPDDLFASEISLFAPLELRADPLADIWAYPIETVAKSERGLDRTRQGESITLRWPLRFGEAIVEVDPRARALIERIEVASGSAGLVGSPLAPEDRIPN
ncbi:MAG TPA: alpha-amylase/4-alpha-glucanotransferase domain-containing protein [Gemmatimonadales bacterium]|nr:alpha-amylase/4-alpha-glucanotransferase domain-containing protein [Gemmatimonadales bacterium]